MKTPPFLLGATLIFWGLQTGFLWVGIVLAVVLEGSRFVKARWEFTDEDFSRLWVFCSVLFLGAAVFSFTSNEGPSRFGAWLQNPTGSNTSGAGRASADTATSLFRWLPMIFFPFVAAQAYSPRQEIPLTIISQILRWRWKKLAKDGRHLPPASGVNVGYPYFAICLFAASNHAAENSHFFWGLSVLLAWVLWTQRSRRFGVVVWLGALAVAVTLGFAGQRGIGRIQNYLTSLNPEWLYRLLRQRFDPHFSDTSLGQIGNIKGSGRIVVRLEPVTGSAPAYLREAAYRVFSYRRWSVDSLQRTFEGVNSELDGITWLLLPAKTNLARVKISCYLDSQSADSGQPTGLLPLPEGCGIVEDLPSYTILKKNGMGAVAAEGPGLVMFVAGFGPGSTLDAPFNPRESVFGTNAPPAELEPGFHLNPDLNVSTNEKPVVARIADELGVRDKAPEQKLRAVKDFFESNFTYSTWQRAPEKVDTNMTPLGRFLLETRSGHCEFFATATVLLLRELGIPARYAVGYAVHETSGKGYVVRERDAHAWCIAWNERAGVWEHFDTTPASWIEEEAKRASPMQWLSDAWSWIRFQISRFRWGQTNLRQYLLWLLAPVLAVLLYQIIFRRKRRQRRSGRSGREMPAVWPGLDSEFYLIERNLAARGVARRQDEPLSDWLERATNEPELAEIREALKELLRLHYRCRFDPPGLSPEDRLKLKHGVDVALEKLAGE